MTHATPSGARPVNFLTEDGVHVRGAYHNGTADRALTLVLIHDAGADRTCWDPYVPLFRSRGWNVLTFDLRGHGESLRQDMRLALLRPDAGELTSPHVHPADVRAAVAFAQRQPGYVPGLIALVGLGFGSDLAYAGSARGWGGASTVCVGLDEERARLLAGNGSFSPRGCYLLYGSGDWTSAGSAQALLATAAAPAEAFAYPSEKTGLPLWQERQPEILARSIAWIEKTT